MGRGRQVKKTFLSINGGKIVERVGSTEEKDKVKELCPRGAVARDILNKAGLYQKTVFEIRDDYVEGIITNINMKEGSYGWELQITIQDMEDEFVLSIPANSDFFKHFAKKIKNVKNVAALVRFTPFDFETKDGTKRRGITLSQLGEPITWFFTKDNNHGMPEFTKMPKDKPYPEWTEELKDEYGLFMKKRDRWLRNYVIEEIAPMFAGNDLPEPVSSKSEYEDVGIKHGNEDKDLVSDDDLPF